MNAFIKSVIFIWLMTCAIGVWFACALLGFVLIFIGNLSFMYEVMPLIALSSAICIMRCAWQIVNDEVA